MTDERPAPPPRRRIHKALVWGAAAIAALVALALILVVGADTQSGRNALARFLRDFEQPNGLRISVSRIDGSIYGRMTLRDLQLRDPQGVFLTSPAVTVDWRPGALIRNHLLLREASSDLVRVFRRPALRASPRDPNQPLLPGIDITVGRLALSQIVLEAPVVGRRHVAAVNGSMDLADRRALLNLQAAARPHDGVGGGDRLSVRLDATPSANQLQIDAQLAAPADGVVAGLTGLVQPLALQVTGAGTWAQWNGRALGQLGQQQLADLTLGARAGQFTIAGDVRPALVIGGAPARLLQPAVRLDLAGTLEARRLQADLRARSAAFDVTGRGLVDLGRNRFGDFRIEAALLRPTALLDNVAGRGVRLSLGLDGAFATPRVDYALRATAIGFGDTLVEDLQAQGRFTVGRTRTVAPIRATARRVVGVDEAVGGILRNMRLDGDLVITGRQIASDNLRLRSDRLNATLVVAASLATGEYDAVLKGQINRYEAPGLGVFNLTTDARLVPAPNGQFRLRGSVQVRSVRIDNAALRDLLGGQLTARGLFERSPDGAFVIGGISVASPGLQVRDARGRISPEGALAFAGTVDSSRYGVFSVAAEGSAARPLVRVRSAAPRLGAPLTNLDLTLRPAEGGYAIAATAASPYGPLQADVGLQLGEGPMVVDVRRASLAGLLVTGRLQQTAAGPFAGSLALTGPGLRGDVRLSAAGGVQQIDLSAQAQNARLPLGEPLLIARGSARATAILYPDAPAVNGQASLAGLRRGAFTAREATAQLTYRSGSGQVELTAAGESGVPYSVAASANIAPNIVTVDARGEVNRIPIRLASPAQVRRTGGGWRLMPATLVLPQGRVELAATLGDGTRAAARLQSLDLSILRAFLPDLSIGGVASGALNVTLPAGGGQPTGRADLAISGLTRTGLATVSAPVDVAFVGVAAATGVDANAVVRRRSVVIGRLQARLAPIPRAGGSWMERMLAAPVQGGVRYNGPAEVLWGLTGMQGQEVTGPVAVGADFSGTLGQPRTDGVVRARALRYENQAFGTVVDAINVEGRLDGSRLNLSSISGRAGRGTLQGSGYINLAADEGFPMDLRLQLRNARLANSDDLAAALTGQIAITNSRDRGALISGEVVVEDARYRIARTGAAEVVELTGVRRRGVPLATAQPEAGRTGLPSSWRLDIGVVSDNRIFVSGMGLDSEWQASLRVGGTADRPSIVGDIRSTRGTFSFAGRRLALTRGIIRFAGETPPNPTLDIQATTTVEGVAATIDIGGRADNPQIAFTSTPALPQDEVLSRLLFGNSVTELSATQALQLAASLNSLRGGGGGLNPLGSLRQAAGVDRLRIVGSDAATGRGAALSAGKYISNDVYVEVTTDARGFTAIQLEIALTRSLSILSQVGSFGGTNLNLRYTREY